jgi:hypothetical protein
VTGCNNVTGRYEPGSAHVLHAVKFVPDEQPAGVPAMQTAQSASAGFAGHVLVLPSAQYSEQLGILASPAAFDKLD